MDGKTGQRKKLPKYLFFTAGENIFTSRLSDIKEVVNELEIDKVPLQNTFTVGMSSLRGEIISLLSLSELLSYSMQNPTRHVIPDETIDDMRYRKMVTLVIEHKNLKYGLLIDNIKQVGVFDSKQFKESCEYPWIKGHYQLDSRIATVIDLKLLLEHQCPDTTMDVAAA